MVELREGAITELMWRDVIVSDVLGVLAAPERAHSVEGVPGQRFPVGAEFIAGKDHRHRSGWCASTIGKFGSMIGSGTIFELAQRLPRW